MNGSKLRRDPRYEDIGLFDIVKETENYKSSIKAKVGKYLDQFDNRGDKNPDDIFKTHEYEVFILASNINYRKEAWPTNSLRTGGPNLFIGEKIARMMLGERLQLYKRAEKFQLGKMEAEVTFDSRSRYNHNLCSHTSVKDGGIFEISLLWSDNYDPSKKEEIAKFEFKARVDNIFSFDYPYYLILENNKNACLNDCWRFPYVFATYALDRLVDFYSGSNMTTSYSEYTDRKVTRHIKNMESILDDGLKNIADDVVYGVDGIGHQLDGIIVLFNTYLNYVHYDESKHGFFIHRIQDNFFSSNELYDYILSYMSLEELDKESIFSYFYNSIEKNINEYIVSLNEVNNVVTQLSKNKISSLDPLVEEIYLLLNNKKNKRPRSLVREDGIDFKNKESIFLDPNSAKKYSYYKRTEGFSREETDLFLKKLNVIESEEKNANIYSFRKFYNYHKRVRDLKEKIIGKRI